MKTITICGKEYDINCNALTYVKYKSIFKTGILKDMQYIQNYLIKQAVIAKQLDEKKISEAEKLSQLSEIMINDTDEFVSKITQIAWILIYTANNKVESYETWLSSITKFNISDDWISEVTEFAVDCFC
jgi:hypothetical protein